MNIPHLDLKSLAPKGLRNLTITLSLITLASPQWALASHQYPPSNARAYPPFDALCTDEEIRTLGRELNNPRQVDFVFDALTACGSEAVPLLVRLFQSSPPGHQSQALEALIEMGPEAKAAIPVLESELNAADSSLRAQIPQALATIGGADTLSILLGALRHRDPMVKSAAVTALGSLEAEAYPAVPALRRALRAPQLAPKAAQALGQIGPGAQAAVPNLIARLSGAANIRFAAVEALGDIGPAARTATPALVDLLGDSTTGQAAGRALADIGAATVPDLLEALKSRNATVQHNAVKALGLLGPDAAEAAPLLARLMPSSDQALQADVFKALANMGKPAVPVLITALDDPSLRGIAAISLGNIGPDAEAAVPALLEIFERPTFAEPEPPPLVQPGSSPIIQTGLQIRPDFELELEPDPQLNLEPDLEFDLEPDFELELDPILVNPSPSPGRGIRLSAALALGKIGANTDVVVPDLIRLLNHSDWVVRSEAAKALGNLGPVAAPAIPDLVKLMEIPGGFADAFDARNTAASALINLGSPAVSELITALADPNAEVHSRAAYALGEIGSPAIAALNQTLNHRNANVRHRAAFALGKIGQPAVPVLLDDLKSDRLAVRKAAAYSLGITEVPNPAVITALQPIVDDDNANLDLRRTAASSLELLGIEQSSFFSAFNLPGPQTAVCLPKSNDDVIPPTVDNYEFDAFTGDCLVTYEENITEIIAGLGDILTRLCDLFGC
ncbi:MAG: HEAT repeat domain-containing protein [Cyanobacteria bacterium P01_D01_bin.44]